MANNEFTGVSQRLPSKEEATPTRFCESDRDLLIRVDERSERVERWCYNHDAHHFRYMMLAWSVAAGAIVTLAIALIKGHCFN